MCPRVFPVIQWKRLGILCACCGEKVERGDVVYLTQTDAFCSRLCVALHTTNEVPSELQGAQS